LNERWPDKEALRAYMIAGKITRFEEYAGLRREVANRAKLDGV